MLKKGIFDISIREMRPADLEALMQIKNAENWNQTEEDWLFLIRSNPKYCLVAVTGNKVIGSVTAMGYQQKLAWIGMMLVSENYRGFGVSKILLNNIIKRLDKCNSIKLDATPAGIPVYKKIGFVEEYAIDRMVCSKFPSEIIDQEDARSYEISKILPDDINGLLPLDKMIFGIERPELFRYLSTNKKKISFQLKQEDHLKGFIFCREGSNYMQIGPLVADSLSMAKVLLNAAFKAVGEKPILVDVLEVQKELKEWLLLKKFNHERSFKRMYLKSNDYSGKKENQFLISGPELG